ncbi:hypothetical protein TD95_000663 [Thielaviopsis punctulata]|uniref:Lysophospholipase n=1 Tax=Thielaviopsis punctulata TaxID=72032 RepID=A0A0F4ZIU7_9PEZI|nr:hypothetical protein TD95_000663 [Thielaviopsis punctulata]
MKAATALLYASSASASAVSWELTQRAAPDAPSGGYAPAAVQCPSSEPTIRSSAAGISAEEEAWLKVRTPKAQAAFSSFVERVNITGFNATQYLAKPNAQPRLAAAISGGGYRALMYGAGFLKSTDNRTSGTTEEGAIGGLLQSLTYLAGLSGGSWLVGSFYMNNLTTIEDIQTNENLWQFQHSIFVGPELKDTFLGSSSLEYYKQLQSEVMSKKDAGFDVSLTDYWGRALAYQLINAPDGGAAYTLSSVADWQPFQDGDTPMPFIVSVGRAPHTIVVSLNSTVFEFNPLEFGSWDTSPGAFAPIRYLGTNFTNGSVVSGDECVRGFDQASFIMGTSSSLFNVVLMDNMTSTLNLSSIESGLVNDLLDTLDADNNDIAPYRPNPFRNYNTSYNKLWNQTELDLVDGGEDGQNIPLWPVLQPERGVDVIFAVDSSADTEYSWPNGTAMIATYERTRDPVGRGVPFPAVPDSNTFINLKLNQQPTFFGCDVKNFSAGAVPPLIVYMPNGPYTYFGNTSTLTMEYELDVRDSVIFNAQTAASQGNSSSAIGQSTWATCVACAALSRSFTRTNTSVPRACTDCYTKHCWNGTYDTSPVNYEPTLLMDKVDVTSSEDSAASASAGFSTVLMAAMVALAVF